MIELISSSSQGGGNLTATGGVIIASVYWAIHKRIQHLLRGGGEVSHRIHCHKSLVL